MSVTMDDVKNVLQAEEPDYAAARNLGAPAVPHLATLAQSSDTMLASKAVYLASLIGTDAGVAVLRTALGHASPIVRMQAASGARNLTPVAAETLLPRLLGDADGSVRKFALRSARTVFPAGKMPESVRTRIAALSKSDPEPFIRDLATSVSAKPTP